MAIADSYDGFLLDLDGVVWLGHEFLPGAADAINGLIAAGKPVAFITNSPRIPRSETAQILRDGGVDVPDELVVTAASTLISRALEELEGNPAVIAIGTGLDGAVRSLTWTVPADAPTGRYRVRVTATDAAGRSGEDSSNRRLKIRRSRS